LARPEVISAGRPRGPLNRRDCYACLWTGRMRMWWLSTERRRRQTEPGEHGGLLDDECSVLVGTVLLRCLRLRLTAVKSYFGTASLKGYPQSNRAIKSAAGMTSCAERSRSRDMDQKEFDQTVKAFVTSKMHAITYAVERVIC